MGISPMDVNMVEKGAFTEDCVTKRDDREDPVLKQKAEAYPLKDVLRRLGSAVMISTPVIKFDNSKVQEVRLLLKQHVGNPAVPKVKTGDQVKKGDLIAEVVEGIGASLHASISGVVKVITSDMIVIRAEKHSAARGV